MKYFFIAKLLLLAFAFAAHGSEQASMTPKQREVKADGQLNGYWKSAETDGKTGFGSGQVSKTPEQSGPAATYTTRGQLNGRYWISLDEGGKKLFLLAYLAATNYITILFSRGDYERYKNMSQLFWPPSWTGDDVLTALDRLYETPENTPIGISNGICVISEMADGADETTVQNDIADLRARAATN